MDSSAFLGSYKGTGLAPNWYKAQPAHSQPVHKPQPPPPGHVHMHTGRVNGRSTIILSTFSPPLHQKAMESSMDPMHCTMFAEMR